MTLGITYYLITLGFYTTITNQFIIIYYSLIIFA